jgi:5-methylcytosine-specific restriction endonuclease McrA
VSLYNQYRISARKRALAFSLTKEEFRKITEQHCRYCGTAPAQEHCAGYGAYRYNGVDRKNNEEGYTLENVVPCCYRCNRAKGKDTVEKFEAWLRAACAFCQQGIPGKAPAARTRYFKKH